TDTHASAASADHHLIAAPNDLGYLQMSRKKNLVTTELSCQFLADCLRRVGQEVLAQLPDIAFHQAQICRLDYAHALERAGQYDDWSIQPHFSRHEYGPGGAAVAAHARRDAAQW